MNTEIELEINYKIAAAKLAVAEELRVPIAGLASLLTFAYWDSWLLSAAVCLASLLLVPRWYAKDYEAASDAYEKATGTGKYYVPNRTKDAV